MCVLVLMLLHCTRDWAGVSAELILGGGSTKAVMTLVGRQGLCSSGKMPNRGSASVRVRRG